MNLNALSKAQLVALVAQRDAELITRGRELDAMRLEVSIARRNAPVATPTVTYYRDVHGQLIIKTRVGTQARSRAATPDEERAYCTRAAAVTA